MPRSALDSRPEPNDQRDYCRVEAAIRFIEAHRQRQPSLSEVAHAVGLSDSHFQRLFKRWVGISPKRFLQFLTVEHAKSLLSRSRSVLDTALETGLSGPGRLHDLFVNIEAMTPGEFKQEGAGLEIRYGVHDTPFGYALAARTDRGLCGLAFFDPGQRDRVQEELAFRWRGARLRESHRDTQVLIETLFDRTRNPDGEPLKVFLKGTNFQLKVWAALLEVPTGRLESYSQLAERIGCSSSARAVGNAVGANPIAYLIPCHRVIQASGVLGNYRWGRHRKQAMVAWESALEAQG